jgi:dephospho-CoA kinase
MMRIVVTGGIACGKSLAAKFLNDAGIETIDADDVVHELVPDDERRRLAKIVFNDPAARRALEARLHPLVRSRIDAFLSAPPASPASFARLAVIPLLFEVHWETDFDIICCVASERETQIRRMMTTRGYTREEAEARLAAQLPVEEKAAKSHYVIINDGTPDELRAHVQQFAAYVRERMVPSAPSNER